MEWFVIHAILTFAKDPDTTYGGTYEEQKTCNFLQLSEVTLGGMLS